MRNVHVFLGRKHAAYYKEVTLTRQAMIQLAPAGGFGDEQRGNMGGIYNFSNAVHCCSKLFAEGGVAFENYLNESKDFKAYKTEAKGGGGSRK